MALGDISAFTPTGENGRAGRLHRPVATPGLLGRILREPLLHFLVAGGALLIAARLHTAAVDQRRIVVTPDAVAKMDHTFRLQYGVDPTPAARERMIGQWIEEEALFREGVARGLDKDDEIIRRRIVQKMQFLSQYLAAPPAPSEADLRAYYQANLAHYRTAERVTFTHVFFSPDARGQAAALADAQALLRSLPASLTRAADRGDRFPDLYDYAGFGRADAEKLFGAGDIDQALFTAPVGVWSGPYRSGFGWHLIRVASRTEPRQQPYEAVADQVRDDWRTDAEARANQRALADLERKYTIVRRDRPEAR